MDRTALRAALDALATNHLWTWHYRTSDLFTALPTAEVDRHPVQAVNALSDEQLDALLTNGDFVSSVANQLAGLHETMETAVTNPDVAYFSRDYLRATHSYFSCLFSLTIQRSKNRLVS